MNKTHSLVTQLVELVQTLRDTQRGDPWILAQDFKSLATLTIEEAYEFADSVDREDFAAMFDELGDLILHVFLYAELGSELNEFDINTVIQSALDKQARRKLNFNNPSDISAEEALKLWDENKSKEKRNDSILDNLTNTLPALLRAESLQAETARVGFDWPEIEPVYDKLQEEILEVKQASDEVHREEEIGDLLFTAVNLARHYKINPESALRKANQKFETRFRKLEKKISGEFGKYSLDELDKVWDEVKKNLPHR